LNPYILIAAWYTFASVIAFIAFGADKRAAARGRWRIGERQLHFWSLVGGFPGAWIGQRIFRHKLRKSSFIIVFRLTVILHAVGWGIWLWRMW
jgi:uncharacterized membrane protein YsdA (DUF1294 family)